MGIMLVLPAPLILAFLEQKMWFCLFSPWVGMECALSGVSDGPSGGSGGSSAAACLVLPSGLRRGLSGCSTPSEYSIPCPTLLPAQAGWQNGFKCKLPLVGTSANCEPGRESTLREMISYAIVWLGRPS